MHLARTHCRLAFLLILIESRLVDCSPELYAPEFRRLGVIQTSAALQYESEDLGSAIRIYCVPDAYSFVAKSLRWK